LKNDSNGILADTSVWIEFFRPEAQTGEALAALLPEGKIWTCGIVLFELLKGVRSDIEKEQIKSSLSGLKYAEMSPPFWEKAAELSVSLKKQGITLPQSDIFIAAVALERNLSVFTLDKHFDQIPGMKLHTV
jgi:predicted nucleic acid-binding protein